MSARKSPIKDVFWLRITLLDNPAFPPGAPWRMAPQVFERLVSVGLVEKFTTPGGAECAVGTDAARRQIAGIRARRIGDQPS